MSDIQEQIKLAHKRAEENDIKLLKEEIKVVIKQISKMIASGEIPNEVYDKYLSKCPIGFMNENELFNYLTDDITNLQEELKSANESIIWWSNRFKATQRNYEDYKSRNEKAIEYLETGLSNYEEQEELLDILKGDNK